MIFHPPLAACFRLGLLLWLVCSTVAPTAHAQSDATPVIFSEFDDWWKHYLTVAASERPGLVKKGTALARTRRDAMLELIENDPAAAIRSAFAEEYHNALPKPMADLVEKHVRGLAKLTVVTAKDGSIQRRVTIDKESWKAFLYGRRLELRSREEIPIHGVALNGRMAVDGSPLERFPDRESLLSVLRQGEGKKSCPICGEPGTIPAAVGDVLLWFDSQEHLAVCEKALIEKEMSPEDVE